MSTEWGVGIGSRVTFEGRAAKVTDIQSDGQVLLEWTGPWPHPFFTGPYRLDELRLEPST